MAQSSESTFTSTDMIIGTPQYISPEQAIGKKDLDEGTDIYSFGVMLYEMVVGRVPFSADTPFSIIYDHISAPLPLPHLVNPNVPESVERVLLKALAKERADRYETVTEMVKAFKSAWQVAGVPMQGTAVILPKQRESGQTVERNRKIITKNTKTKRSTWLFITAGVLLTLCCLAVVFTSAGGMLNRLWSSSLQPKPSTAVPSATPMPSDLCAGEQTWFNQDVFPEQEIQQCWDQEHYITDLAFDGAQWRGVMTKGIGYTDQAYLTDTEFPEAKIREYWDKGFDITGTYYGDGQWIVVMSKGTQFINQIYFTDPDFPEVDIHSYWNKGYWITTTGYGDGKWVIVMSDGPAYEFQNYLINTDFPEDSIRTYWDDDYDITNATYGNAIWAIVVSSGVNYTNQYYYKESSFPESGIKDDWDNDFFITNLTFGDSYWIVVMSKK